jgi:hypothetical protein
MGLLPKSKVEQLKREKREAKAAKKRKENTRSKIVRFLIVCEGERTEPNYFKALVNDKYSEVREEDILGEGRSTCALVNRAMELKRELEHKRQLSFDRVWVVFDKDDFVILTKQYLLLCKCGVNSAWSNEAFELWYLLHFQYLDTGIDRHAYIEKLQAEIRKHPGYETYEYKKNDTTTYNVLMAIGNENFACQNAMRLRDNFKGDTDYKNHKPCTKVDLLVGELKNPERILKKIILMDKRD